MTVLVVSPNWLGDAVMALPAVADIRRHAATTRLVVARARAWRGCGRLVGGVDEVVTLPRPRGASRWRTIALDRGDAPRHAGPTPSCCSRTRCNRPCPRGVAGIPQRWGYRRNVRRLAAHPHRARAAGPRAPGRLLPAPGRGARRSPTATACRGSTCPPRSSTPARAPADGRRLDAGRAARWHRAGRGLRRREAMAPRTLRRRRGRCSRATTALQPRAARRRGRPRRLRARSRPNSIRSDIRDRGRGR